ncbi:hypothetical protein MNQ98_24495 [Paenibacillus sp. N3/727]|uniref:hypothetical protein n=1 Tax=Paenibacillus sp. N3/727 TaxID=2925845 RepID=UPI001F532B96|nr:hypothetical protein [Paenibacillus sp. N3/727]UNK17584.1 hypothetical protein MNQ98_24495 [Paenibacillus sp. N3/727]
MDENGDDEDDDDVYPHVRDDDGIGDPFVEFLERYSFLDSLIFSLRLELIHIMSAID